jgi:hypothetical protein
MVSRHGSVFTLFRYGLLPVVVFCLTIVAASVDTFLTNSVRKSTWPRTVATVVRSEDLGRVLAEFQRTKQTFSDPRGTLEYVIDGQTHTWQGRGRDVGVTEMNPGDRIEIYYNPHDPRDISTLVLLGAFTGSIILAVALAFLAFYAWFFWLRGSLRRPRPDDFDGDMAWSFAAHAPHRPPGQMKRSRFGRPAE